MTRKKNAVQGIRNVDCIEKQDQTTGFSSPILNTKSRVGMWH